MKNILIVADKKDHVEADQIFLRLSGHTDNTYAAGSKPVEERFSATYVFSAEEAREALSNGNHFHGALFLGLNLSERFFQREYLPPKRTNGIDVVREVRSRNIPTYILSRSVESIPHSLGAQVMHTRSQAFPEFIRNSVSLNASETGTSPIFVLKGYNN